MACHFYHHYPIPPPALLADPTHTAPLPSQDNSTALMHAALKGHLSIVQFLLEEGADQTAVSKVKSSRSPRLPLASGCSPHPLPLPPPLRPFTSASTTPPACPAAPLLHFYFCFSSHFHYFTTSHSFCSSRCSRVATPRPSMREGVAATR